jgi:intracellular sulfur oxidation DsrE/DsrF family protein
VANHITLAPFSSGGWKEDDVVNRLVKLCLLLLWSGLTFSTATTLAEGRYEKQKVVYHINYDDPKRQTGALRNIQNHIGAVGTENLELKVVLHGDGLSLLIYPDSLAKLSKFSHANATEEMSARIDSLKSQGVSFLICRNTVKGRQVDLQSDLYDVDVADVVPSGVAELSYLQSLGFTYIKP